jgi:hypothetical protein
VRLFRLVGSAVLVAATVTACGGEPPPSVAPPCPNPIPAAGPRGTPIALYYVGDTPVGPRLYRSSDGTIDPSAPSAATDAVRQLLGARGAPDPDYRSVWPVGWRLRTPVCHTTGLITVDLVAPDSDVAPARVELARLALQQLVYTVQDALGSTDPVRLLVDGSPAEHLWGQPVAAPIQRADPLETRARIQIDSPGENAVINTSSTRVAGEAATFEANVQWQVSRGTVVVAHGHTSSGQAMEFSPYTFAVPLPPGRYTLRVFEADESDGEGRAPFADTKTFTVRPH